MTESGPANATPESDPATPHDVPAHRAPPVTIESGDRAIVARPQVKLMDDVVVKELTRLVDAATADSPATPPVVVDLSRVAIIPSMALVLLVQLAKKCQGRGQELKLSGVQPTVRQVFAITKLDLVFRIADSVEAAIGQGPA